MSLAQQVFRLEELIHKLPAGRQQFAHSLVAWWRSKRRLSQGQQLWVDKLIEMATAPVEPKPAPVTESIDVDLDKIHSLFAKAQSNHVQVPRLRMVLDDGRSLVVQLATNTGKNPGSIYVQLAGQYYGKIDRQGRLVLGPRNIRCDEVVDRIKAVALNPTSAGRVHGHKHRWCMFCARELTTVDSLYYGYGPICAEKWGLEWGDAAERIHTEKVEETRDLFAGLAAQWKGAGNG
jgi:hypothetical protein